MRQIIHYLKIFWKDEVKIGYLLSVVSILAISIFVEYHFHVTRMWLNPHKTTIFYFMGNIIFYGIPFVSAIVLYISFYKRYDLYKNKNFWFLVVFILIAYSFRTYFYQHRELVINLCNGSYNRFYIKCANQLTQAVVVLFAVVLFWTLSGDFKKMNLYGFQLKNYNYRPYFFMLLIMMPIIIIASTQNDFLHRYPMFQNFENSTDSMGLHIIKLITYEILYGSDFVMTELFFRGFVVFTLAHFLGRGCIIPMAAMYVFIHFGKPAGETISSFFGGTILGVIAYETRSIVGGVIVHCGIAYMMEFGGFIGNLLKNN